MRLALLFLLTLCVHAQAAVPTPIFVLHAYSQEYPWTHGQHQGFVDTLNADASRAYALNVEYLDTKRAGYNPVYADLIGDHLRKKYQGYRPAAVYVTDDNALSFALSHLDTVFPGVPVFFSGVNNYDIRPQLDPARITGVFEKKEIAPNLRLMRQIDPDIREIVIVGDATETYRAIEGEIRQELARHSDIRATFLSSNRIDDLTGQLKGRKERFVFLTTLGAVTDRDGRTLMLPETIDAIVKAGQFVVFSMEDAYLYPGVLGGYLTSGPRQGAAAARLLIRHLGGTPVSALPPIVASPNEHIVDEAELLKAGLTLPQDIKGRVTLVNTLPSFYEANRPIILGTLYALIVLSLLSLLTSLLLFVRKNRQIARASRQLGETKDSLDRAQRIAQMGNWDWHIAENRLFWSEGIYRLFGISPTELGVSYEAFLQQVHPEDRHAVDTAARRALETGESYDIDHRIVRPDGEVRIVHESAEVQLDDQGMPVRMIGTVQDITEWKQAQRALQEKDAHLEYIAYHDGLTGLPNRALLMDRLAHAASRADRSGYLMALLFIDLDRFKAINDSLGHAVGDAVMQAAAGRLKALVREEDTLSRLGGDEFVVLLEGLDDSQGAASVAEKIIHALEKVLAIGNYPLHISASIGISLYPQDGRDAETLMKHADAAMYKAKESGRNTFHFYEQGITERAMRRIQLESRLRSAFEQRTLEVFYQPLVRLDSRRICGAEALLRWSDPQEGAIPPDHFIPLAEDTGLIIPMGEWVIRETCLALKRWDAQGIPLDNFAMHINLSGKQLLQKALPQRLADIFSETGVSPGCIVLELTESSIMESETVGLDILMALRQLGVSIAIDDFGTGHSSLSRLKLLPISELKIDRSFIRDIAEDTDDAAIVQAILALSANLDLRVVAEGVEHPSQEAFLQQHGCLLAQGYYYARPMPEHELIPLLIEARPFPHAHAASGTQVMPGN
ncbi:MAG: EAL domain-containing protein [Thiobacillus sp.]|nr:EAL domain-containing protein [Thiobacillus sp.]